MKWISSLTVVVLMSFGMTALHGDEPDAKTTITPLGQNSYRLDWTGEDGWTVIPQFSSNLVDWFYLPEIDQGVVHDPIHVTPLDGEEAPYPKLFFRLVMSDHPTLDPKNADFDGDGLSNWEELTIYGTDPFKADTSGSGMMDGQMDSDGDGLPDQWEQMILDYIGDPSLTIEDINPEDDFDGDGVTNLQELLLGLNPFQKDSNGDGYGDRLSVDRELHLKFDEDTGTVAMDVSGKGRNGTLIANAGWQPTAGIDHGALEFNGGSDAVTLPAATLQGASDLTISLWFKTSDAASSQTLLSAAGTMQFPELAVTVENGTTIRFHCGGGNSVTWNAGRNLADGLWHHLVIVRDMTQGELMLHLDGAIFASPQSVSLGILDVQSMVLGQLHQSISTYDPVHAFTGLLDDVRIYSAVLVAPHPTELFRPNDLDLDGLPDDWELSLFGNLATLATAGDDLDGDGITNRDEFEAGTHPSDYYNGMVPVVALLAGSGQTLFNGERTQDPLVFLVTDGTDPLVNAPVELSHLELIGSLVTLNDNILATSLTLRTDSEGKVAVHFKAD